MPRHRKECIPKHRALPPDRHSGRRVQLSAAVEAAGTELRSATASGQGDDGQSEEDGQSAPASAAPAASAATSSAATVPLRLPHARPRPSGSRRPPAGGESPAQPHRMRGLLVTPWFAAGAGFVIAAALALNSPHTVLTYRPNTSKCSTCTLPGLPPTAKPGLHVNAAKPVKPARAGRGRVATGVGPASTTGPEIGFRVIWQRDGAFAAIITVPAAQARHGWNLRFVLPGRRIIQVLGANWQPAPGANGGLASMLTSQPWQSGAPGDFSPTRPPGAGQQGTIGQSQGSARSARSAQSGQPRDQGPWSWQPLKFLVMAEGSPVTPVACVLNGASCHFG